LFGLNLEIGWFIILLFMVVFLFLYALGVIDGIDGFLGLFCVERKDKIAILLRVSLCP
jgi:hypothetical protein